MLLTGVNSNIIMSGCGDDNPDDARREAARGHFERVFRGELTVSSGALVLGLASGSVTGSKDGSVRRALRE
jgi:hypothetical protein